ncbi:MAG: hypothetical protein N4A40_12805 [Tissierellales bacterium]|jgi:hypothetical protein|nr:hypothetical protein [Tissierellales bacterium]
MNEKECIYVGLNKAEPVIIYNFFDDSNKSSNTISIGTSGKEKDHKIYINNDIIK